VEGQLGSDTDFAVAALEIRPAGTSAPACSDGLDNDGDGLTDFGADVDGDGIVDPPGDPGCHGPDGTTEAPQCQDGVDNDGRTGTDYDGGESVLGAGQGDPAGPDPDCVGTPWRDREASRTCGLGWEAGLALALLAQLRRRRSASRATRG
jgi:hypothetical protein